MQTKVTLLRNNCTTKKKKKQTIIVTPSNQILLLELLIPTVHCKSVSLLRTKSSQTSAFVRNLVSPPKKVHPYSHGWLSQSTV